MAEDNLLLIIRVGLIGFTKNIRNKKGLTNEFIISGNGKQVRDILYVDNVVNLCLKVIKILIKKRSEYLMLEVELKIVYLYLNFSEY